MMQESKVQSNDAGGHALSTLGVVEAAEAIRKGEISSERYTSALLQRARAQSDLNAFVTIDETALMEAARDADKQRNAGGAAPLLGVPVGIKDSYLTKGLNTSFGLDNFDFIPDEDAIAVSQIKQAGGIVFGKNNLVSMSYGLTGKDSRGGQVKNPHDTLRVSGGSSSGAAASVGAGIIPAALGGDTVGSIRVPASLSGVVGFKPTTGRWPSRGIAPISTTLEAPGVLARSVADCSLIDRVLTGTNGRLNGGMKNLKGVRLLSAPRQFLDLVTPEVHSRFEETVRILRAEGAEIVEVDLGHDYSSIVRASTWTIFFHETLSSVQKFLLEHKIPMTFDDVFRHLSQDLQDAWGHLVLPTGQGYFPREAYEDAVSIQRGAIQKRILDVFNASGGEAFLFPTTPCTAPLIEHQLKFTIAGHEVDHLVLANNTVSANFAGLPAVSIPSGFSGEGLPMGLELDARPGADTRLLELADLVERTLARA